MFVHLRPSDNMDLVNEDRRHFARARKHEKSTKANLTANNATLTHPDFILSDFVQQEMDKTGHPLSVCQIVWLIKLFSLPPINKTYLFFSPSLYPITTLSLLNEVLSGLNAELVSIVITTLLSLGPVQSVKSQLEFGSVL